MGATEQGAKFTRLAQGIVMSDQLGRRTGLFAAGLSWAATPGSALQLLAVLSLPVLAIQFFAGSVTGGMLLGSLGTLYFVGMRLPRFLRAQSASGDLIEPSHDDEQLVRETHRGTAAAGPGPTYEQDSRGS